MKRAKVPKRTRAARKPIVVSSEELLEMAAALRKLAEDLDIKSDRLYRHEADLARGGRRRV